MVYLVHQWWPATKKRGHNTLKVSIGNEYRLHFLVPGGEICICTGFPRCHYLVWWVRVKFSLGLE